MKASVLVATTACGVFFLTALLYSFACLVLIHVAELSPFAEPVNVAAVSFPLLFFMVAIATCIQLGWLDKTDDTFEQRSFATTTGVVLLGVSEIGGFAVLLAGFVLSQLR